VFAKVGLQDVLTNRSNFMSNVVFQFLYGAWLVLEGKAYANKPYTIQELENNIRREIAAISENVLQATFANVKRRVQLCLDSGGEHFQHLL
jgi:hypothetical protein